MEDVLDTYEKPYDKKEPVVCLDEKPVQLLADKRPRKIARAPGKVTKKDYEYKRCGTANVFCMVEPKMGRHFAKVTANRKGPEFAKMVADIANFYPMANTIHLILDNLNTHRLKSLVTHFGKCKGASLWSRFTVHYTPKHASWLNQAEIGIGIYSRQCLGKSRIPSIETLQAQTSAWNLSVSKKQLKIDWSFTSYDARKKFSYEMRKN